MPKYSPGVAKLVKKEIKHRGKRSKTQAIAIALSRARKKGMRVPGR